MNSKQKTLFQAWKQQPEKSSHSNPIKKDCFESDNDNGIFKIPRPVANNTALDTTGFDIETGKTWIYPTNFPVRDYQFSIVKEALFKNTMVVLPTGLGKTFVAAVVMYNIYRWYPKGKVVFMAPTKPLVAQQVDSCFKVTGISEEDTTQMTGNVSPDARKMIWQRKRVFFLTPQVMANDLVCSICPAESIKCLVIDEAHKALGNHSYCQVVRELLLSTSQFRILALTATPGSDIQAVKQVITNLLISHIELRSEDSPDVLPYTHTRDIEKLVVPLGEDLTDMKTRFLDIINIYLKRLNQRKAMALRNPSSLSKFQVLKLREAFSQHPPANMDKFTYGLAMADFSLCISLYHAYELLLFHGVRPFYSFLIGIINGDKSIPHARSELKKNYEFEEIMKIIESNYMPRPVADGIKNGNILPAPLPGHPKLVKLEEVVLHHFRNIIGELPDTRVMIFSQYRDSVQEITELLHRHQPLVKVMSFIGQATTSGSNVGYSQKHQLKVIEQFRKGGYNTLVSTCVGEEGLDIGEVDLIICFDSPKSPVRLVQRMGRTGRLRKGRIILLVTEGKEEQMCNSSEYKKKYVNRLITKDFSFAQFYQNNPLMVPRGVIPACVKTVVTIKPKKTIKKVPENRKNSELTDEELEEFNTYFRILDPQSDRPLLPKSEFVSLKKPSPGEGEQSNTENAKQGSKDSVLSLSNWTLWQDAPQKSYMVSHSLRSCILTETMELLRFPDTKSVPFSHKEKATLFNMTTAPAETPIRAPEMYADDVIEIDLDMPGPSNVETASSIAMSRSPEVIILDEDKLMESSPVIDSVFDKLLNEYKADFVLGTPALPQKNRSNLVTLLFGDNIATSFKFLPSREHILEPFSTEIEFSDIKTEDFASVDITAMLSNAASSKTHSTLSILNKKMKARLKRKSREPGSVLFDGNMCKVELSPQCQQVLKEPINSHASTSMCVEEKVGISARYQEILELPNSNYDSTNVCSKDFEIDNNTIAVHARSKEHADVRPQYQATVEESARVLMVVHSKAKESTEISPPQCQTVVIVPNSETGLHDSALHQQTKSTPADKGKAKPMALEFDINFGFSGSLTPKLKNFQNKAKEKLDLFGGASDSDCLKPITNFKMFPNLDSQALNIFPQKPSTEDFEDSLLDDSSTDDILEQLSLGAESIPDRLESFTLPLKVKDVVFENILASQSSSKLPPCDQQGQFEEKNKIHASQNFKSAEMFINSRTNNLSLFEASQVLKHIEANRKPTFQVANNHQTSHSHRNYLKTNEVLKSGEASKIAVLEKPQYDETHKTSSNQTAQMLKSDKIPKKSLFESAEVRKKLWFQSTDMPASAETSQKPNFQVADALKRSNASNRPTLPSGEIIKDLEAVKKPEETLQKLNTVKKPALTYSEHVTNISNKNPLSNDDTGLLKRTEIRKKLSLKPNTLIKNDKCNKKYFMQIAEMPKKSEMCDESELQATELHTNSKAFKFLKNEQIDKISESSKNFESTIRPLFKEAETKKNKLSLKSTDNRINFEDNEKTEFQTLEVPDRAATAKISALQTEDAFRSSEFPKVSEEIDSNHKKEACISKNKIPATFQPNSVLNEGIKTVSNQTDLIDSDSSQFTLSQALAQIHTPKDAVDTKTTLKSDSPQCKKESHMDKSSEDEVCPTPPKCLKANLSKFSYRSTDDIEESFTQEAFPTVPSKRNAKDLDNQIHRESQIRKFSIFDKIDNVLPTSEQCSSDGFTQSKKLNHNKAFESYVKTTSPQKLSFDLASQITKLGEHETFKSDITSASPQKLVFDMSFGFLASDEVLEHFFSDENFEELDDETKNATSEAIISEKKEICVTKLISNSKVSHPVLYDDSTKQQNLGLHKQPITFNLFKKPEDVSSLVSRRNSRNKTSNVESNSCLVKEKQPNKNCDIIEVPKVKELSLPINTVYKSKLTGKENKEHLSSTRSPHIFKENNVIPNKLKRTFSSSNENDDDFKTGKKLKTTDPASKQSKNAKISFSIFRSSQEKTASKKTRNPFLLSQAEVSGSDSSKGGSDEDGYDDLEASFIDDMIETQQNKTDQHAFYLESTKSHVGMPQKFKLKYNNNYNDNVFSQPIEPDNSTYLQDSFCVDDDEVEYESPINKTRLKRKKDNFKHRKRRRILTLESSSDSEDGCAAKPPSKMANIEEEREKPKKCSLKTACDVGSEFIFEKCSVGTVNSFHNKNEKKTSKEMGSVVNEPVSKKHLFRTTNNVESEYDSGKFSTSKLTNNTETEFTFERRPYGAAKNIENKFKFQKPHCIDKSSVTNVSELNKNYVPNAVAASSCTTKSLPQKYNMNKVFSGSSSSTKLGSVPFEFSMVTSKNNSKNELVHENMGKNIDVDIKRDTLSSKYIPSKNVVTDTSKSLVGTNTFSFDISWTGDIEHSVSVAENKVTSISNIIQESTNRSIKNFENRVSSTCNEIQNSHNSPYNSSKPVVILVDSRQLASAKTIISALRNMHKADPVIMQLNGVDYVISNRIAIDRILDTEFNNSFVNPKIIEKVRTMCESYEESYVIFEKDGRKQQILGFNKSGCKYSEFAASLVLQTSTKVLYSDSAEETSHLLSDLAEKQKKRNFHITVPVFPKTTNQELFYFYSSLPHVNIVCALNLLYNYPYLSMFLRSTAEELKKVAFISTRRAQAILQYARTDISFVTTS